jgi:ATP-dependent protease HslVU (ClpYQ) peptidase subunit
MSTVVGVKEGDDVWIGGDSRCTTDEGYIRTSLFNKVFKNGNYLIGIIGSPRAGQLLTDEFFEPPEDIYLFADQMREWFEERGCLSTNEESIQYQKGNVLIGYNKNLYEILTDFTLYEIDKYTAIGSGCMMAFGSLHTTGEIGGFPPEKRIEMALKAADSFDAATGPPFKIYKL